MVGRYRYGAVRFLGVMAIVYGISGILSSLYRYYFQSGSVMEFFEFLHHVYFQSPDAVFQMAYYVMFTIFGIVYIISKQPPNRPDGYNPKAYAMIGFTFLFVLFNVVQFTNAFPFDFSLPDEFNWYVVRNYVESFYLTVGEVLMIIALINYLRGGVVIRKLMFLTFLLMFIMAVVGGMAASSDLIEALRINKGVTEVCSLINTLSFVVISFLLLMFSFSHDRKPSRRLWIRD